MLERNQEAIPEPQAPARRWAQTIGLILIALFAVLVLSNSLNQALVDISIKNNWTNPIYNAVNSPNPTAIQLFGQTKSWLEAKHLTRGNTSTKFFLDSPSFRLEFFYKDRIVASIQELEAAESLPIEQGKELNNSNLSIKLHERWLLNGEVREPENFNLYIRWGFLKWFGLFLDSFGYTVLVGLGIGYVALAGSSEVWAKARAFKPSQLTDLIQLAKTSFMKGFKSKFQGKTDE